MSESILKVGDGSFLLYQKGDKKYRFNPPRGNLLLTDRRLIFAKSAVGFGKRVGVNLLTGVVIGGKLQQRMDKVNPQEIEEALLRSDSFELPLTDIVKATAEAGTKGLTNSKLHIKYKKAENTEDVSFFLTGSVFGSAPPNDWVNAILDAKNPPIQSSIFSSAAEVRSPLNADEWKGEETALKISYGDQESFILKHKDGQTLTSSPKLIAILTDKRLLFAQATGESSPTIASIRTGKVNSETLNRLASEPNSFFIPLKSMETVFTKNSFTEGNELTIRYSNGGRINMIIVWNSTKRLDNWANLINSAKVSSAKTS
jgi:hypothetical protein